MSKQKSNIQVIKMPNSIITYYWNLDNNAVTASIKMSDLENDIKSTVDKCFGYNTTWHDCYKNLDWTSRFCDFEKGNHTITATSMPHGGDEFNIGVGERLSRDKVLAKYYKIKEQCLYAMLKQLLDINDKLISETKYATIKRFKFSNDINKLCTMLEQDLNQELDKVSTDNML